MNAVAWTTLFWTFSLGSCSTFTFTGDGGAADAHGDVTTDESGASDANAKDASPTKDVNADASHPRLAFITSTRYTPAQINGASGADAICNAVATAASLSGTYTAWLSTSTSNVASRLTHGSTPWTLADGVTIVAADFTNLTSGTLAHAIDHDEHDTLLPWSGYPSGMGSAWTASHPDGTYYSGNPTDDGCSGMTLNEQHGALVGYDNKTDVNWSTAGVYWCFDATSSGSNSLSLYCFED